MKVLKFRSKLQLVSICLLCRGLVKQNWEWAGNGMVAMEFAPQLNSFVGLLSLSICMPCLSFFHSLTGCDTVSFFSGRSKRTAWNMWKVFDDVTAAFCGLATIPHKKCIEEWLPLVERFIVLLYDRTSSLETVLMKPESSFLPRRVGLLLIDSLPLKLLWWSISREQPIRLVIAGPKQ